MVMHDSMFSIPIQPNLAWTCPQRRHKVAVNPVMRFSVDIQGVPPPATPVTTTAIQLRGNQDMSFGNDPQHASWSAA
ncbi:hypothetical protein XavaCFBP5823_18720 [Xanthomonas axonopodis pv. vasculorum]|nr:hypothetical protein XavaCFBP5823_18720 [Xanthomonas axonopodis pv. vasculorum]